VFTKCSLLEGPGRQVRNSLKRDSVRREAHASLERLGIDAIDLYQIHWPRPDEDIEEGWSALVELRDEGLVRHIGVSNFSVAQLERIAAIAPVESLQPPYSLIARDVEAEILPYAQREGIGVIVYSPMGSGMLTGAMTRERIDAMPAGDWRRDSERFREPALSENLATAERVRGVAERLRVSPGAVAIAWALRSPAVDGAIVGLRRPEQADALTSGAALELSDADAAELEGS
jgi:aryl-alcohol dehydrogenase-like predicted oxidoreductase